MNNVLLGSWLDFFGKITFRFNMEVRQIIINGRRFFEMTAHYQEKVARIDDLRVRLALLGPCLLLQRVGQRPQRP